MVQYLSPGGAQIVWATNPSPKGKFSKKGLALSNIVELKCENGGVKIEMVSQGRFLVGYISCGF